jgi:lipopolysaccharide transport system ATP-binding protein
MSEAIITVSDLGKKYRISHVGQRQRYVALRDVLANGVKNFFKGSKFEAATHSVEDYWALQEVSFEIKRGEVVGIIGRNGAGKSTLLKILSRITEQTVGRVHLKGRVASLLEVGTGFHPELTGSENIFLNGAILGMSRSEIRRKFDEIVAFAEVEQFLDTPVKRFSSGMYVRLAFAVAAHLEPEILVVDEVLAVGDAQFQKKCLGKMRDVSQQGGRTVLFVSHNMAAISQLTASSILLNKGRVCYHGPTAKAVEMYMNLSGSDTTVLFDVEHEPRKWLGTQAARFVSLRFDRTTPLFAFQEDFSFIARIRSLEDFARLRFSITIFMADGTPVGSSFSSERPGLRRGEAVEVSLSLGSLRLAPGHYYCGVGVGKGDNKTGHVDYDVVFDTLNFEVRPEEGEDGTVATWTRGWGSMVFPELLQEKVIQSSELEFRTKE